MIYLKENPYFMTNEDWYYYDNEKGRYVLTENAPKEAIESYKEFYELIEKFK